MRSSDTALYRTELQTTQILLQNEGTDHTEIPEDKGEQKGQPVTFQQEDLVLNAYSHGNQ